jgi:hypothetical protein
MVVSSYWVARRRTRATVPGLVGVAPLPRRGSVMVTGVVAVPCQLISAWQVKAGRSMVRVKLGRGDCREERQVLGTAAPDGRRRGDVDRASGQAGQGDRGQDPGGVPVRIRPRAAGRYRARHGLGQSPPDLC